MDLNYARDTTSGQEGLDLLHTVRDDRPDAAGRRDDRLGQRRRRGRGDAPRRPRLRPEAVGQRAPAGHRAHAGRAVARRCAAASGSRPRTCCCAATGQPHLIARVAGDAAGAADDRARRPVRRQRPDHRRERHRQGPGRAARCTPCPARADRPLVTVNAGGVSEGVFESELFGHVKRRVHRRQGRSRRPLRAGRRRHAVPRRDRQRAAQPAEQAAARARDRRVRAARLVAHAARQRPPASRRPTPTCTPRSRPAASARICCSASTRSRSACRRCASAARTSRRWPCTSCSGARGTTARSITGFDPARDAGAARARLAGQRPRARSRHRARRADGPGPHRQGQRSRPARRRARRRRRASRT